MCLFSGCKQEANQEDRLAAASFLFATSLAWDEYGTSESKHDFQMRIVEKALALSPEGDVTRPIWIEAKRKLCR